MPQGKVSKREGLTLYEQDFKEASFHYVIAAFEEICEEDASKVWKALPSHTKAEMRRMMAIEQIKVGEM